MNALLVFLERKKLPCKYQVLEENTCYAAVDLEDNDALVLKMVKKCLY